MVKALMMKELREVAGIAAIGLGIFLVLVGVLIGLPPLSWWFRTGRFGAPFLDMAVVIWFAYAAVPLALTLGFRQSAWEGLQGTYLFLLHRPVRRETVFFIKLAIGSAVTVVCMGLAILLYAGWAALPKRHPSPFAWSMTAPYWQLCCLMPLLYLGAFLSGLRPARWYGTRLLPLIATGCLVPFLNVLPWFFSWWRVAFPLALAFYGLLIVTIFHVARMREYS
jgi:hypothetical protein